MIWLTQQTFDRLEAELEDRRGPRRAEIVERISAARDEGDLKENGGYHAAKDEQGTNEARIRQLEDMLASVTTEPATDDGIGVNVFSPESPLGAALLGHSAGETVDFEQPNGKVAKIEIISAVPFSG